MRQQIGYKQYILIIFFSFCLHLTQFVLFTNYVFKQIIIYGRQFEFTLVKVVKFGVEHYNYKTAVEIIMFNIIIVTMAVCLPEF